MTKSATTLIIMLILKNLRSPCAYFPNSSTYSTSTLSSFHQQHGDDVMRRMRKSIKAANIIVKKKHYYYYYYFEAVSKRSRRRIIMYKYTHLYYVHNTILNEYFLIRKCILCVYVYMLRRNYEE